jgi:type III restriction enzyme
MTTKTETKQFQYEIQGYQEDCVNNIIRLFKNLRSNKNFVEVLTAHQRENNYHFPVQDTKNIDIMMETGTGKTFTFIKTIFELSKHFSYKKFIILVPSVAIREGTKTNLEDTKDYFKSLYANEREKEIETFVYEGGNTSAIRQFIGTSHLSVLVMTPSSFNQKDNILNRPLERDINTPELFVNNQEPPKSYLECLKRLNPIVIMDEPHRFDGNAFRTYFDGFNNYFLRFGATFPKRRDSLPLSNVAYVLDSISSFRQSLVKKIVVYTQDVVENTDTLIGIENNKAIVNTLTNGIIIRRELGVGAVFNGKSIRRINKDSIVLADGTIEKVDYSLSDESLRAMIKQTIKIHFEKEKELFERGIKALTLFFMPNDISLYRGENPKIKNFFEEEYIKQRAEIISELDPSSDYYKYLQNDFDSDNHLQVHKGYFSGDKGKNNDEKIKAGVDEILKDKKKLLSFDSPTRFIFSIWALQEGWDNPNVFTICKLSNQGSEISKLQQIGRGLRICVNQNLQRKTLKNLNDDQETFWKINNLDVVVSSKEQGFVEAIQNEILSNSFLISGTFTEQELKIKLKEKGYFDDQTVRSIFKTMEDSQMIIFKSTVDGIDVFEKSPDFSKILKEQNLPEEHVKVIESLFATDTNTYVQKAEKKKEKKKVFVKATHLQEFQNLWNAINKNAFYVLETLTAEQENQLIQNIKTQIEALNIEEILLQTIRAELNINKLDKDDAIKLELKESVSYKSKVDYLELIRTLSNNTKTPISFVVKIFNALSDDFKTKMLCNNPEQAQREISEIINKNLIAMLKANIRYDGINGTGLPNVFKTENGKTYLDTGSTGKFQKDIEGDFNLKSKWVFEEVIEYDSDFELEIVEQDPDIESIEIFGKLPRLKIKTPLGDYNPDFCYAIKSNKGNKIFLVVEAKGYNLKSDIHEKEQVKIDFAKKYFEALSQYYKDQNIKISFKERINKTQLAALIKEE